MGFQGKRCGQCGETNISPCVCFSLVKHPALNLRASRSGGSHTLMQAQRGAGLLSRPAFSSERNSHKVWVLGFCTPVILLSANRENILETISFLSDFILNSDQ